MKNIFHQTLLLPQTVAGLRLDQALTQLLPDFSRTQIQGWIKNGDVRIHGQTIQAKQIMWGGEQITIDVALKPPPDWKPQPIPLSIIFEDEALLIINKPIGMVVHPGAGNSENTLLNALLHHEPQLQHLPRAGIIHRLDKDTSGLLVIAKTEKALKNLSKQLKARHIKRIYQAVVEGALVSGGTIDAPIGRHPIQRKRMAVTDNGKEAITHYRIIEKYLHYTRLKIILETGRTHQIRVHFAHIHHPLLGDPTYGGRLRLPKGASAALIQQLRQFKRQALHAYELELTHPLTQKHMAFQAPLPEDLKHLIQVLKNETLRE